MAEVLEILGNQEKNDSQQKVTGLQSMHPGPVTIPAQRYTLAL
jgi:hypothetical protein